MAYRGRDRARAAAALGVPGLEAFTLAVTALRSRDRKARRLAAARVGQGIVAIPAAAAPATGTFYVSGTSPSTLPPGSDAAAGTLAAPFATLTFALTQVPAGGDYLILCDGTFAENSGGNGRWILNGVFTKPVLFKSYTGTAANFIISPSSTAAPGVVTVRGSPVSNVQIQFATIRPTADAMPAFTHNPTAAGNVGRQLAYFDCIVEKATAATVTGAVTLIGDTGVTGLNFVRCSFVATTGSSTTNKPAIIAVNTQTQTLANQPHTGIGFYDCTTSTNGWDSFSTLLTGVNGLTIAGCTFSSSVNYALLLGSNTSGGTVPKVTNAYVGYNTLDATGAAGHGLEIGENVIGALVEHNTVTSTLQGIVAKGASRARIQFNTVTVSAGALNGIYAKASDGTIFLGNTVTVDGSTSAATAFREDLDATSGVKSANTSLTSNTLNASGATGTLLQWAGAAGSTGGARSDSNSYHVSSSATFGSVRGTSVASLANVQAAWVSAGLAGDLATNDANSVVV